MNIFISKQEQNYVVPVGCYDIHIYDKAKARFVR